jgi:hypothetical protein
MVDQHADDGQRPQRVCFAAVGCDVKVPAALAQALHTGVHGQFYRMRMEQV